ncbi:hypothetical protein BH10PLA1_BH10PLA1_15170 [soil metagenome]
MGDVLRFSLIMPTLNRTDDVRRFMNALNEQTFRDLELIVVDQAATDELSTVLEPFRASFPINHIRTGKPLGAAAARNLGAAQATGELIGFPDDDCYYDPDYLRRVSRLMEQHADWDGVTGGVVGLEHYYARQIGAVKRHRVWWQVVEFNLFVRRPVFERVGPMDPTIGPGAKTPWGAGEAADWALSALEAGKFLQYLPDLLVHHPGPLTNPRDDRAEARCVFGYSVGKAHVLRKHGFGFPFAGYLAMRPLYGVIRSLLLGRPGKAKISWAVSRGIMHGWRLSAAQAPSDHDMVVHSA